MTKLAQGAPPSKHSLRQESRVNREDRQVIHRRSTENRVNQVEYSEKVEACDFGYGYWRRFL